ncbi:MAG: 4Fe-4S dicluster domain-containing protein [Candidatus Marinimicrobia bacterium]|nr:4Fe-4S dicluster domain-containing protein [Candidatus Neomarinimicrobiota bacterium]MBT6196691.1 4Fe-4S dicluster domain-containing protein [Candidatus Neomarinimicrobiota bacterium]
MGKCMRAYFRTIRESVSTLVTGMGITWRHMVNIRKGSVTLQYPEERWPRPERNIGFDQQDYNIIRSRLHVDINDCIGCLKCERACPVDCIKISTERVTKGEDIPEIKHTGVTSNETKKALLITRFDIDMTECCYCNLCTYPCPEECIFMTGGPNSEKHHIDYEFSQYDRNDMVYRFAKKVSDEQVAKATGINGEKA